ncbi:MAG: hypothetical protein ACOVMQ_02790 [Cyclobacteriaceae bacterium]|jgi:uncharacterized tellurite resistance protein B-like protein
MNTVAPPANYTYQLGLLHFVHVLMAADGIIHHREQMVLEEIKREENISSELFEEFRYSIAGKNELQVFREGVEFLNTATDQERLCALVHLYQLSEADENIHEEEVRFLFNSLKQTKVDFEDVVLASRLAKSKKL